MRGPHSWVDQRRAVGIGFEDGFLRERWSDGGHVDTGRVLVCGRIRLGYSWQVALGWFARFLG